MQQRQQQIVQLFRLEKDTGLRSPLDRKIYSKETGECLGFILVGQRHLLYQKYILNTPDDIKLDVRLVSLVDDVVLESRTHSFHCHNVRFLEFQNDGILPSKYWYGRHMGIKNLNSVEWSRRNLFGDSWYNVVKPVLDTPEMSKLSSFLTIERRSKVILPKSENVFRAFKLCSFEHTKVIILGQDPYYQEGVADGLAFSYKDGKPQNNRKALDIILEEIETSVYGGFNVNYDYDLSYLAQQGVFLLNTALTVQWNNAGSHLNIGWERFTGWVLKQLYIDSTPKVFMLWGEKAQTLFKSIVTADIVNTNHSILLAKHPAADIYVENETKERVKPNYPKTFLGNNHFVKANEFLIKHNRKPIEWMQNQSL